MHMNNRISTLLISALFLVTFNIRAQSYMGFYGQLNLSYEAEGKILSGYVNRCVILGYDFLRKSDKFFFSVNAGAKGSKLDGGLYLSHTFSNELKSTYHPFPAYSTDSIVASQFMDLTNGENLAGHYSQFAGAIFGYKAMKLDIYCKMMYGSDQYAIWSPKAGQLVAGNDYEEYLFFNSRFFTTSIMFNPLFFLDPKWHASDNLMVDIGMKFTNFRSFEVGKTLLKDFSSEAFAQKYAAQKNFFLGISYLIRLRKE